MASRTAYAGLAADGDVYTAANHARMPGGWIGYVETTSDQNNVGTVEANLAGLSVSAPVNGSRRVKITGAILVNADTGGATQVLRLYRDAVEIQQVGGAPLDSIDFLGLMIGAVDTPSSGPHTYKLTLQTEVGTVDVKSATSRGWLLVEDVGPAS